MCHGCGQLYGTSECLPRNSGGVRNSEFTHGVSTTLSSCKQNTNLFRWAGAYHTNKVGVLVSAYFLSYFPAQQYSRLELNAKRMPVRF